MSRIFDTFGDRTRTFRISLTLLLLAFVIACLPHSVEARQTQDAKPYQAKLSAAYDILADSPFAFSPGEVERYGQAAMGLSGDARIYALWRVLYAYKTNQNEAMMRQWHDRVAAQAALDGDSNLDLLARFMQQAFVNETSGYKTLSEREWATYLSTPDRALQNIVTLERERQMQYDVQWAEAIDLGEALVLRLKGEGKSAAGLLMVAQQSLAYNMTKVGDYDAYADHIVAMVDLSRNNAFFLQKMDMLYDLAYFAMQDHDISVALRMQALYASYVRTYNISELSEWDELLCAQVKGRASDFSGVIQCLRDSAAMRGQITTANDAMKLRLITQAYARLDQSDRARVYLKYLKALPRNLAWHDPEFESYINAYLDAGDGKHEEALHKLQSWADEFERGAQRRRTAAVQDMYKALRKELDSQSAEARLLQQKVQMQRLLLGSGGVIAVMLALLICGCVLWVMRMRRMHARLNAANEHAEAANAAKTRFLAVMSHELRTPLNGVLGMAQALKKDELTEAQRDQVNVLVDSGHTLMTLLNDVLDLSRIEADKIELSPTVSTMKDMVDRVVNTYASLLEGKEVELRCDIDDGARLPMMFDVLRVYQCLSNLVSNALKFTERGSVRIIVSTQKQDVRNLVRVEVRDTGIGMSRSTVARLFTDYTQADAATTRKYGGSGLGLSISRRLAELMGGTLSVHSEEGVGSTFTVTFLADDAPSELAIDAVKEPATAQVGGAIESADNQGTRILLVDDHPVNRKVARLFLEPFGFIITEACDGQEALDLEMSRFDLVLMDINMPRVGGLEATRIFRASEAPGKHVPIIALTADAMQEQVEACLAAGMDAHLSKPIIMDTLVETVTALLKPNADREAEVA